MKSNSNKLILELLILTFENEKLKRCGAIGYFKASYPNISDENIIANLNNYLTTPINFEAELAKKINHLSEKEKLSIKTSTELLIQIIGRHMDLPGEKRLIEHRFKKLFSNLG